MSLPFPGRPLACGLGLVLVLMASLPMAGHAATLDEDRLRVQPTGEGFVQVIADGTGHRFDRRRVRDVAVGPDGTVWVVQGRRVLELGRPGAVLPRSERWHHDIRRLETTPASELWAVEDGGDVVQLAADVFEDRSDGRRGMGISLAAFSDGQIWRTVRGPDGRSTIVASEDGERREDVPTMGLETLLGFGPARHTFARTDDGRTWFGVDRGERGGGLAVLEEDCWTVVEDVIPGRDLRVRAMEPGVDGTLWVLAEVGVPGPRARHVLVGLRQDGATVLTEADGMPQDRSLTWTGWSPLEPAAMAMDGTGTVWFSIGDAGLWTTDGTDLAQVMLPALRGGVLDLDVGPDGGIWAVSRSGRLFHSDRETGS